MSTKWPSIITITPDGFPDGIFDHPVPDLGSVELLDAPSTPGYMLGDGAVSEAVRPLNGSDWPGVNDTFYNRILIEPTVLQMGNLLTNQNRNVVVWNGYLDNRELTSFNLVNGAGITVVQPVAAPYMMRGLEELTYTVAITTDGPPVIDADLVWVISGGTYRVDILGRRVVVWPYGPSWDSPVLEILQWLTDILRAYDGTEQRRGLRFLARRTFTYTAKVMRDESARLENLLWGWQNRLYAMPVWTDKPRLQSDHTAGDLVISVPTPTYSFAAGTMAIIYRDVRNFEVVEIESVGLNVLNLLRPLEGNWSAKTIVMPVMLGHMPSTMSVLRRTSQAMIGSVTFESSPLDTNPYTPDAAPAVTYKGLEVLLRQPNWRDGLSNQHEYRFVKFDWSTGPITWDTSETFPRVTRAYPWLLSNRNQIRAFREMLGRRVGMLKPLLVPTWHDDFRVLSQIGAADTTISVKENEFRQMVGVDPTRNLLMIRLRSGTNFYREIVGVTFDGAGATLQIDEALGVAVALDQIKAVHLLMRSRMASDEITLSWRSDGVVETETPFTTIKE